MKKYQYVVSQIQKRIENGLYPPQSLLPKQEELASEFSVSKMTIKRALDVLTHDGQIFKKSGLGTIVLGGTDLLESRDAPANAFDGLTMQQGSAHVTSKIIRFTSTSNVPEIVYQRLSLATTTPLYDIIRLRLLDGQPFILEHTYMPVEMMPSLSESVVKGSIYRYLHEDLKIDFGGARRRIQAAEAMDLDVKYLGAKINTPILEIEQVVWTSLGKNIEYSKSRNLYDTRAYNIIEINDG
ncbi:GntR family transcriptional regulator [Furfurilactobacillus curtus]|uniref:Transcriptional regulator n=1 Tax=Furfurilactobacillus curtus TaxID=1746200 RepID=A0ABQ5JN84_9LACO